MTHMTENYELFSSNFVATVIVYIFGVMPSVDISSNYDWLTQDR